MRNKKKSLCAKSVSPSPPPAFNHEQYTKDLDLLIKLGYDEYKHISIDCLKVQFSHLRTYLWLASVIFGAQFVFFRHFFLYESVNIPIFLMVSNTLAFYVFSVLALFCSLAVFCLGIYAMCGKEATPWPLDLLELSREAYKDIEEHKLRSVIIRQLHNAIVSQLKAVDRLGSFLRKMSWGLLASIAFSVFAILVKFH